MNIYTFKIKGYSSNKDITIEVKASDKASAIINFLTQYPEYSNKIICEFKQD